MLEIFKFYPLLKFAKILILGHGSPNEYSNHFSKKKSKNVCTNCAGILQWLYMLFIFLQCFMRMLWNEYIIWYGSKKWGHIFLIIINKQCNTKWLDKAVIRVSWFLYLFLFQHALDISTNQYYISLGKDVKICNKTQTLPKSKA